MIVSHTFTEISPDNRALRFLSGRIESPNYRGARSSQHNRYTMEEAHTILQLLDEYAPDGSLMQIRTTDLSKRPQVKPGERQYTKFCERCAEATGKGTPDAMRKNLFPDFHRMGLIIRWRDGRPLDPYDRGPKKHVSLSEMGRRFVDADMLCRQFIFTKGVSRLLEGRVSVLLTLFNKPDYGIKRIDSHEYTFFVSAIGAKEFGLTVGESVDMIRAYRVLTNAQRRAVVAALKVDLTPKLNVPKPQKRDFHNWHNKTQQIYHLLKQTRYFDVNNESLVPIDASDSANRLGRSLSTKHEYFKQHGVTKHQGFELHHVVPLSYSESKDHFKLLDRWENIVYIDGQKHASITQGGHRNVIMRSKGDDIDLLDHHGNPIKLVLDENIKYSPSNKSRMIEYNKRLLGIRKIAEDESESP